MATASPSPSHGRALGDLPSLWRLLDVAVERHSCDTLREALSRLDMDLEGWLPWARFDANSYCRRRVHLTEAYEALVLGWLPGQCSVIHDHRGSACAFKVLKGVATEHRYTCIGGRLVHEGSSDLRAGVVRVSQEDDIHALGNGSDQELATLHIYSRPLSGPRVYEAAGRAVQEVA